MHKQKFIVAMPFLKYTRLVHYVPIQVFGTDYGSANAIIALLVIEVCLYSERWVKVAFINLLKSLCKFGWCSCIAL
jgi:hypothetical protein